MIKKLICMCICICIYRSRNQVHMNSVTYMGKLIPLNQIWLFNNKKSAW